MSVLSPAGQAPSPQLLSTWSRNQRGCIHASSPPLDLPLPVAGWVFNSWLWIPTVVCHEKWLPNKEQLWMLSRTSGTRRKCSIPENSKEKIKSKCCTAFIFFSLSFSLFSCLNIELCVWSELALAHRWNQKLWRMQKEKRNNNNSSISDSCPQGDGRM